VSAATVALRITDDLGLAVKVERLLVGLSDDECESVLLRVKAQQYAAKVAFNDASILRAVKGARHRVAPPQLDLLLPPHTFADGDF